jgi:hypothetical protein
VTFWLNTQEYALHPLIGMDDSSPPGALRFRAIPRAFVTSSPVWLLSIAQPTTMRENASMTAQQ